MSEQQRKAGKKLVQHPSTARLFQRAATRFMDLQRGHRIAADRMWAGTLAAQFTADELALLHQYLSQHDHALLASLKRCLRTSQEPGGHQP